MLDGFTKILGSMKILLTLFIAFSAHPPLCAGDPSQLLSLKNKHYCHCYHYWSEQLAVILLFPAHIACWMRA